MMGPWHCPDPHAHGAYAAEPSERPCDDCGGQGAVFEWRCCGRTYPDRYGQETCCNEPVMEAVAACVRCGGSGIVAE